MSPVLGPVLKRHPPKKARRQLFEETRRMNATFCAECDIVGQRSCSNCFKYNDCNTTIMTTDQTFSSEVESENKTAEFPSLPQAQEMPFDDSYLDSTELPPPPSSCSASDSDSISIEIPPTPSDPFFKPTLTSTLFKKASPIVISSDSDPDSDLTVPIVSDSSLASSDMIPPTTPPPPKICYLTWDLVY